MSPPLVLPSLAGVSARIAAVLAGVRGRVTRRISQAPVNCYGVLIPLVLANLINGWIARRTQRIEALLARIAAGTQRPPRAYQPRLASPLPDDTQRDGAERAAPRRMPLQRGWLCALAQEVRVDGCWLANLINEAAVRDAVVAHPQLARLIRPLLRMLGERMPPWVPPPPKRTRVRRKRSPSMVRPLPADDACAALARLVLHASEVTRQKTAPPVIVPAGSGPRVPPGWCAVPGHAGRETGVTPPAPRAPSAWGTERSASPPVSTGWQFADAASKRRTSWQW